MLPLLPQMGLDGFYFTSHANRCVVCVATSTTLVVSPLQLSLLLLTMSLLLTSLLLRLLLLWLSPLLPPLLPQMGLDGFYSTSRANRCVVCGCEEHYLRYRVVPACYRRCFPTHLKSHRSHDIVLLCLDCHQVRRFSRSCWSANLIFLTICSAQLCWVLCAGCRWLRKPWLQIMVVLTPACAQLCCVLCKG